MFRMYDDNAVCPKYLIFYSDSSKIKFEIMRNGLRTLVLVNLIQLSIFSAIGAVTFEIMLDIKDINRYERIVVFLWEPLP